MDIKKFHPRKSLGQNFLINPRVVQKIIEAADLKGIETVVEVGPGFGILTKTLLACARRVIAIEKDRTLYLSLRGSFSEQSNLKLIHADALKVPPPKEPYCLVANIPYSITSPLLDHFIRENPKNLPKRAVLLVQKEVAQKICAKPPRMNVLALHVQTFGSPRIIATVSRNNFKPVPKVDSAIIKIEFQKKELPTNLDEFFRLIHKGFSQKRKMLRNLLSPELLKKTGIEETRRAETLTIEEWNMLL
ncbi:ribosomal RNA small subunit methyltransferase A [Candidatus Peregrinibacteria bacterium]|nr:ribosomal RNA small subunit methyltransferase A [Candidatus Peregrinibacteria bacterium]